MLISRAHPLVARCSARTVLDDCGRRRRSALLGSWLLQMKKPATAGPGGLWVVAARHDLAIRGCTRAANKKPGGLSSCSAGASAGASGGAVSVVTSVSLVFTNPSVFRVQDQSIQA